MVQTNQTLSRPENTVLFSICALDCEGLVKILERNPLQNSLLEESDLFHALWQASHNGLGYQTTYDAKKRQARVKIILRQLFSAGINPLNIPRFGGMPYVANWAAQRAGWSELAYLCEQHHARTPHGGTFLHALCEQGLPAIKLIAHYMAAFGYPRAPEGSSTPWLEVDKHGQTPCHVLWTNPTPRLWDSSEDVQASLQLTQWCVDYGLDPIIGKHALIALLDQRRDMKYLLADDDTMISSTIAQMKRTALMKHARTMDVDLNTTEVVF